MFPFRTNQQGYPQQKHPNPSSICQNLPVLGSNAKVAEDADLQLLTLFCLLAVVQVALSLSGASSYTSNPKTPSKDLHHGRACSTRRARKILCPHLCCFPHSVYIIALQFPQRTLNSVCACLVRAACVHGTNQPLSLRNVGQRFLHGSPQWGADCSCPSACSA